MRLALALSLLSFVASPSVHAQRPATAVTVRAGASVPVLGMAEVYRVGPAAAVSLERGSGGVTWRADGQLTYQPGAYLAYLARPRNEDPLYGAAVLGHAVFGRGGPGHLVSGLGVHCLAGQGGGLSCAPGVHVGAGATFRVGRATLSPEVQAQVVLSDRASNSAYRPSVQVPVTLGVRL